LNHDTDKQTDEQAVAIAWRRDEKLPGRVSSECSLAFDGFADLAVLVDDKCIVLIAICMELGQDVENLFLATVRDEETRRFRDDEQPYDLERGEQDLHHDRHAPRPRALDVQASESCHSRNDSSLVLSEI
jgi:hypothetical protein